MSSRQEVAVWRTSERSDFAEMPRLEEQRHHSHEDQFYTYSDDDSGSINDAYFLPPTSPPNERYGRRLMNGGSETATGGTQGYQARLQPWSESGGDSQPLQDSTEAQDVSASNQGLASQSQSSYGSVVDEISLPGASPARMQGGSHHSLSHIADKKLYRQLRRKQLEHIAREKAVHEVRGKVQDLKCRDTSWAVLFVIQLLLVAFAAFRFGSGVVLSYHKTNTFAKGLGVIQITDTAQGVDSTAFTDVDDVLEQLEQFDKTDDVPESLATSLFTIDYQNVLNLCGITGFYACVLSVLTVGFMLIIAKSLIQTVLVFSIVLSLAWGLIGASIPVHHFTIPIMGFIAFFVTVGYTIMVWDRIPFAATNLNTTLCALRSTADITIVGLGMLILAFAWCILWSTAFIGIVDTINTRDCGGIDDDDSYCTTQATHSHIMLYILLVTSFFWTNLVIKVGSWH